MLRKLDEKKKPHSSNGGPAGLDYDPRARAGSASKAADVETQKVFDEISRLVEASRAGRLDERGNAGQFQGKNREMVEGINAMLDAILLPIGEGNRILAQISSG